MYKEQYKKGYSFRIEIGFLLAIFLIMILFYIYPRFEYTLGLKKSIEQPDFIITEIPRTFQQYKKIKPPQPVSPTKYDEVEFLEDVEIAENEESNSSAKLDSLNFGLLYYEDLLPYLGLGRLDSQSLEEQKKPLDLYHDYLNYRLTEIFKNKNNFKSRTQVDDILAQSMGRNPNMMQIDIGQVIVAAKDYINSNKSRTITINNIINTEKYWYILELLWKKKGQTVFEIYADDSVRKKNTIISLKESMQNLKENGLVTKVAGYERDHYFPTFSPDEMVEIVNKLSAQHLSGQHKNILSSFMNFIIMHS